MISKLLASEELVDVHELTAVLPEVQLLFIPMIGVDIEVGSIEKQNDILRFHRLVARLVCAINEGQSQLHGTNLILNHLHSGWTSSILIIGTFFKVRLPLSEEKDQHISFVRRPFLSDGLTLSALPTHSL